MSPYCPIETSLQVAAGAPDGTSLLLARHANQSARLGKTLAWFLMGYLATLPLVWAVLFRLGGLAMKPYHVALGGLAICFMLHAGWTRLPTGRRSGVVGFGCTYLFYLGALLLTLPLISILAFVMMWHKEGEMQKISSLARQTLILVPLGRL